MVVLNSVNSFEERSKTSASYVGKNLLNCCPIALNQSYKKLHDEVLAAITSLLKEELGEDFNVTADIETISFLLTYPSLTYTQTLCASH